MNTSRLIRVSLTLLVVLTAAIIAKALWDQYMYAAWTRDGRVRAEIISIAPDVSGQVEQVLVKDNQLVHKGDVLFRIDAARYEMAYAQLQASIALHAQPGKAAGAAAQNGEAQAELNTLKLNLERTQVRSPVDGYITNLRVHAGDYAQQGRPALAIVDQHSFWVYGYFEETRIPALHVNDPVKITLMSGGRTLNGHIESIARAIADRDNTTGSDMLANVNPTFSWVRLAQRIPVHISIDQVPEDVLLSAGMTCTVQVLAKTPST